MPVDMKLCRTPAVDLGALPRDSAIAPDPRCDKDAGAEDAFVEELQSTRPEAVEAVRPEVGVGVFGKAIRVDLLGLARVRTGQLASRSEQLDPPVRLPPSLARVLDRDRDRAACAHVARMTRMGSESHTRSKSRFASTALAGTWTRTQCLR